MSNVVQSLVRKPILQAQALVNMLVPLRRFALVVLTNVANVVPLMVAVAVRVPTVR